MAEQDLQLPQVPTDETQSAGTRLRRAREALRLSRADIAARTKIAERHLAAIEEERFGDLASSTYAVGFSRAYARAVGLDEREIAHAVREELDLVDEGDAPAKQTFEPGDPARVPSLRLAWLAGVAALVVIACVGVFWGSYIFPAASLPDLIKDTPPSPAPAARKAAAPAIAPPSAQSPVTITATKAGVWVKIVDASGKQLFQKEMALGETYTIPPDAAAPQLRTAWPDALQIAIGGRPVAPLADKRTVLTVPISAAALLARPSAPPPVAVKAAAVPPVARAASTPAPAAPTTQRPANAPASPHTVATPRPAGSQPAAPRTAASPPAPSASAAAAPHPAAVPTPVVQAPVASPAPVSVEPANASTVSR